MSVASVRAGEAVASVQHVRRVDPISPVVPEGTPHGTEAEPRKDDARRPTVGSRPDSIESPVQASPATDAAPRAVPPGYYGHVFTADGMFKRTTRTTIEVRKDLLREARARAERTRTSVDSIFESALWKVLDRSRRNDEPFPAQDGMPTYGEWRGWYDREEWPKPHYDEAVEGADHARSNPTGAARSEEASPARARATVDIWDLHLMKARYLAKRRRGRLRDLVEEGLEDHLQQPDPGGGSRHRPVFTEDGAVKLRTRTTVAIRKDLLQGARTRAERAGLPLEAVFEEALLDVLGRPGRRSELLPRYLDCSKTWYDWWVRYLAEEMPKPCFDETAESGDAGPSTPNASASAEAGVAGPRVRTTVDIRDAHLIKARYLAKRRSSKLRDVIEDGLDEVLKWPLPDPTAEARRDEERFAPSSSTAAVHGPEEGRDYFRYRIVGGELKQHTRTTVDIGRELLLRVRDHAWRRAVTLKYLVAETLEKELARPGRRSELVPAEGGDGVPGEREWFRRYVAEEMSKPRYDETVDPGGVGASRPTGTEASERAADGHPRFLTVNIDDFLLMRARNLARRRRTSLGAVIADGLAEELDYLEPGGALLVFRQPTEDPHNPGRTIHLTVNQMINLDRDPGSRYEDVEVDIDEE